MQRFIAKIGKGHKGAKDLTWEEAKEAMSALIEGTASPVQVGAFLMAMRIKTESISELAAFTATARRYVPPIQAPAVSHLVDLPCYGEKHETVHVVVAGALLAVTAGARVLLHSTDNAAAASTIADVLRGLGIPTEHRPDAAAQTLMETGFAYLDLALYHPPLARLLDLRQELGLQNLAHQVARMINPVRAPSQLIGVGHPPYVSKIIEALRTLGTSRAIVFQGVEGSTELSISAPTPAHELRQDRVLPLVLRPHDINAKLGTFQAMSPADGPSSSRAEQEAAFVKGVLANRIRGDRRAWVVFNAALILYAAGAALSLRHATPLIQEALDSGAALRTLQTLSTTSVDDRALFHQTVTA
ncbi:MAG: anthranilate phosphoribosyltransferase [Nitrospirae bacterium]|nr:MAG: anthranilate phosphoribosyltransferase [Nitrospirota bacterium]